jgi:hypothetical protein
MVRNYLTLKNKTVILSFLKREREPTVNVNFANV